MTPAARLQAAADILDSLKDSRLAPELVLKNWGTANRYAGSKDRRAIADRVFQCLRAKARLSFLMGQDTGRALVIGALHLLDGLPLAEIDALYSGQGYGPKPLSEKERNRLTNDGEAAPEWLQVGLPDFVEERLKRIYGERWKAEAEALMLPRAPIDLRVNGDREKVLAGLEMLGYQPIPTPFSAYGIRLPADPPPNVRALPAFRQGLIEIQDEGSQLVALLSGAKPEQTIIDYCAGGGGKTLALLQMMQGQGRLISSDVEITRLNNIKPRLARANVTSELRHLGSEGEGMEDLADLADLVLVDAPCSGSGVWRRRPEKAHHLTETEVRRLHQLQVSILARAAKLVRIGGRFVYATCSILVDENEDSCAAFEDAHPNFISVPIADVLEGAPIVESGKARLRQMANATHRLRLSPASSDTDGFFMALYERKA